MIFNFDSSKLGIMPLFLAKKTLFFISKVKLLIVLVLFSNIACAKIILPAFFKSNMILQQNSNVKIWGWAKPFEKINVITSWDNSTNTCVVNKTGKWEVTIDTPIFGGPYVIDINDTKLMNVLIGEVWLVSGQSNMEWTPKAGINDAEKEIKEANYELIRFFNVAQIGADYPQQNTEGTWESCTPESMKNFSAIGYFYAQKLHQNLGVPVGIINASWGGTPAETWTPTESISADPILNKNAQALPDEPWGPQKPGKLFNGMISPFLGLKIKGFLWYQGESNVSAAYNYDRLLSTLINSWRKAWEEKLPFYYVQIAPFEGYKNDNGVALRNAQLRVESQLEKVAMVVISDIGDVKDIHPKNKKDVGLRLANMALKNTYELQIPNPNGPKLISYASKNDKIILYFDTIELICDTKCRDNFEISDISGNFMKAKVTVKSNSIELCAKEISYPIFARFEWNNATPASLKNKAGLPVSAFITDNWLLFKAY
jgi:sialate O-acetylesterase